MSCVCVFPQNVRAQDRKEYKVSRTFLRGDIFLLKILIFRGVYDSAKQLYQMWKFIMNAFALLKTDEHACHRELELF